MRKLRDSAPYVGDAQDAMRAAKDCICVEFKSEEAASKFLTAYKVMAGLADENDEHTLGKPYIEGNIVKVPDIIADDVNYTGQMMDRVIVFGELDQDFVGMTAYEIEPENKSLPPRKIGFEEDGTLIIPVLEG